MIKITPADSAFSKCVRERANWHCEKCTTYYPPGPGRRGLSCSHHFGRSHWSVRFNPLNAESLCTHCHFDIGGTKERFNEVMDEEAYEILLEQKNDINLGREYRRTKGKGEVAKHYRNELKYMEKLRGQGWVGNIEFSGWI